MPHPTPTNSEASASVNSTEATSSATPQRVEGVKLAKEAEAAYRAAKRELHPFYVEEAGK